MRDICHCTEPGSTIVVTALDIVPMLAGLHAESNTCPFRTCIRQNPGWTVTASLAKLSGCFHDQNYQETCYPRSWAFVCHACRRHGRQAERTECSAPLPVSWMMGGFEYSLILSPATWAHPTKMGWIGSCRADVSGHDICVDSLKADLDEDVYKHVCNCHCLISSANWYPLSIMNVGLVD